MASIKITITDTENGRVSIQCSEPYPVLTKKARARDITAAEAYALGALAKIIRDSQEETKEAVKAKYDAGLIPATPSTRRMFE